MQDHRLIRYYPAFLLCLFTFLCPSLCSQELPDNEPIQPPGSSSILLTVDFSKELRSFSSGSVVLSMTYQKASGSWDIVRELGYNSIEIRIKSGFKELFPDPGADPSLPESYNFTVIDDAMKKALEDGMSIALCFEADEFPQDIARYTMTLEYVLKHLFSGWNNGFRLSEKEINCCAFDCRPEMEGWKEEESFRLYALFALSLKKLNPKIPLGGPGFLTVFKDEKDYKFDEISPLYTSFAEYLKTHKTPLDVLLIHHQGMIPYGYFLKARTCQQKIIKEYASLSPLYRVPKIAFDAHVLPRNAPPILEGTVVSNAVMCLIKGGADLILLPFDPGEKDALFYSLKMINILKDYPVQLETIGLDRFCLLMMAAKSRDGKKACFIISGNNPSSYILEKKDPSDEQGIEKEYRSYIETFEQDKKYPPLYGRYHLHIENMPWDGKKIAYKRFTLDENHVTELTEEKTLAETKILYFNKQMKIPGIDVITVEAIDEEKREE